MLAILFLPLISILIYLIVRGDGMTERGIAAAKRAQEQHYRWRSKLSPAVEQLAGRLPVKRADQLAQEEPLTRISLMIDGVSPRLL